MFSISVENPSVDSIRILSIFADKLLVGEGGKSNKLLVYNTETARLSKIATVTHQPEIKDATWTPRGSILIVVHNVLVVLTLSGKVISRSNKMPSPISVTASSDGILYVSDFLTGLHKSGDDGVSWTLVVECKFCVDIAKVITDHSEDFWTREQVGDYNHWRLRIYSFDLKLSNSNVTRRDVNIYKTIISHQWSNNKLATDGSANIFLLDLYHQAVFTYSVDGQYQCKLLMLDEINKQMQSIAIDRKRQVLYVGRNTGLVSVFKLI